LGKRGVGSAQQMVGKAAQFHLRSCLLDSRIRSIPVKTGFGEASVQELVLFIIYVQTGK
jgi:hypothetical protein